jgi:hypothetical protein
MDTEILISRLAESAEPVRRLRPPWIRAVLWLALGLPPVLAVVLLDGLAVDLPTLFADRRMLIEEAAIFATAVTAAVAALASTIPGAGRKWFLAPTVPLAVWLFSLGETCVSDWQRLGLSSLHLRFDGPCFLPMVLMGVIPTAAMLVMLRRGVPLAPRASLVFGTLAVAALATFGLRLVHIPDVSVMVLVWNFSLLAIFLLLTSRVRSPALDLRHVTKQ